MMMVMVVKNYLALFGIEDEIVALAEKAIVKAGEYLNLSLPLAAEGKKSYNGSWKDCH